MLPWCDTPMRDEDRFGVGGRERKVLILTGYRKKCLTSKECVKCSILHLETVKRYYKWLALDF